MKKISLLTFVFAGMLSSSLLFSTTVNASERWTYSCPSTEGGTNPNLTRNGNTIEGSGLLIDSNDGIVDFNILYAGTIQEKDNIPLKNIDEYYYRKSVDYDTTTKQIVCYYESPYLQFSSFNLKSILPLASGVEWQVIKRTRTDITVEG